MLINIIWSPLCSLYSCFIFGCCFAATLNTRGDATEEKTSDVLILMFSLWQQYNIHYRSDMYVEFSIPHIQNKCIITSRAISDFWAGVPSVLTATSW